MKWQLLLAIALVSAVIFLSGCDYLNELAGESKDCSTYSYCSGNILHHNCYWNHTINDCACDKEQDCSPGLCHVTSFSGAGSAACFNYTCGGSTPACNGSCGRGACMATEQGKCACCGDGMVDRGAGEQCESMGDCQPGFICENCTCRMLPLYTPTETPTPPPNAATPTPALTPTPAVTPTPTPRPAFCGDGVVSGNEQCEHNYDCEGDYACTHCICERPTPTPTATPTPTSSQQTPTPAPTPTQSQPRPTPTSTPYQMVCGNGICDSNEHLTYSQPETGYQCTVTTCPQDCPGDYTSKQACPASCASYATAIGYSDVLGSHVTSTECDSLFSTWFNAQQQECFTTCGYNSYVDVGGCCVSKKHEVACSDCPGPNPVCPGQSSCPAD